jgi:hypothetical protein
MTTSKLSEEDQRVAAVAAAALDHLQESAGQVHHARRKEIALDARRFVAMYDALKSYDTNRTTMRELPPFTISGTTVDPSDPDKFVSDMVDQFRKAMTPGIDPTDAEIAEIMRAVDEHVGWEISATMGDRESMIRVVWILVAAQVRGRIRRP